MSNGADREGPLAPEQDPEQAAPGAGAAAPGDDARTSRAPVRLKSPQALERLRDRVQQAAHEIERLRQENRTLHERIGQLETRPPVDLDGAILALDEDPALLREKIEGFIKAIDAYLARESS